jgi:serine O-acetyltransferase
VLNVVLADLKAKQALYCEYEAPMSMLRIVLTDGTMATMLYRLMNWMARRRFLPGALFVHLINKWMNGCVIGVRSEFGPGLVLIHPIGIVINSRVHGGANVRIESGVVIGENRGRCPLLGDDIFIGSGAKLIGGITIGSGARIGANSVVLHDVAAGTTVAGIPAKPLVRPET